jgi:signal transduction histidine kinase
MITKNAMARYAEPMRWRELSLANKTLVAFGGSVVVVVLAALTVPFFRMTYLVDAGQLEVSRHDAITWEALGQARGDARGDGEISWAIQPEARIGIVARRLPVESARGAAEADAFVRRAIAAFEKNPSANEFTAVSWAGTTREYRYAQPVRADDGKSLAGILLLERRPVQATRLLLYNSLFLFLAGSVVLVASVAAFYFVTHKVFLKPVRSLKETAERVRDGNLAIRSDISTGDEFEQLAKTFNSMLSDLQAGQDRLRGINAALDLKLNELAQSNVALHEAAKLKGEFLANVSHELRTPLNSIIGFAELLLEIAKNDASAEAEPPPGLGKRLRYNENILAAARNLLALINSLLEMAKIEAGKVELHLEMMRLNDTCEGLLALITPQADKKSLQLRLEVAADAPTIRTDVKKFQQIIFNFLSNAVKFTEPMERTGRQGVVTLRAERLLGSTPGADEAPVVLARISVIDNGPGIPPEEHSKIFEKFHQLDGGATKEHAGTGLGLAISRELAQILGGEIQLVSDVGKGSMFSLILPLEPSTLRPGAEDPKRHDAARHEPSRTAAS